MSNYIEKLDQFQNLLMDWIIKLQKMKNEYKVEQVKNPFVIIKDYKYIENFLRGKATRYTICGPQVWVNNCLDTNLSCVFPWVYNNGYQGFHELNNTIYYFLKTELPEEITMEYLIRDCKKN